MAGAHRRDRPPGDPAARPSHDGRLYAASATDFLARRRPALVAGLRWHLHAARVICTARDAGGNQSGGTFTLTVTWFVQPDLVATP